MKRHPLLIVSLTCMLATACGGGDIPVINQGQQGVDTYKENMINANKLIAQSENTQIDEYVSRRGWKVSHLDNGARLDVLADGTGSKVDYEDSVTIQYRLEAINGTVIYEDRTETFVVGRHQTTAGLDRALMELSRGAHARVILPSSLAYGVAGDGDRVPARAILVYDLKVIK